MALPTPETVAPGIAAIERAIALLEAREAAKTFSVTSADQFTAVAAGDVSLSVVTFSEAVFAVGDAAALANGMAMTCTQALALANADASAAAAAEALTYDLPGLPGAAAPPPTDAGFDITAGSALAIAPATADDVRQLLFEDTQGTVRVFEEELPHIVSGRRRNGKCTTRGNVEPRIGRRWRG